MKHIFLAMLIIGVSCVRESPSIIKKTTTPLKGHLGNDIKSMKAEDDFSDLKEKNKAGC